MNNPWAASDTFAETETARLDWLWGVLYTAIRDMAVALPTPVRLPLHTPDPVGILERFRDAHLYRQDLPADIRDTADRALTSAVLTARPGSDPAERRELITEAQARVRAVVAYMGVEPDDHGAHDTSEEMTLLDR